MESATEENRVKNITRPNPLLFPTILKVLVTQFGFEDLKSFRLTCKIWNASSNILFRKKALVKFSKVENIQTFCSFDFTHKKYFVNYEFNGIPLSSELMERFMATFGGVVESLIFNDCDWTESQGAFRQLLEHKLSNLKSLDLRLSNRFPVKELLNDSNFLTAPLKSLSSLTVDIPVFDEFYCSYPKLEEFLYCLLINTPNLEVIQFPHDHHGSRHQSYFCRILFHLLLIFPKLQLNQLNYIHLRINLSPHQIKLFQKKYPTITMIKTMIQDEE